MKHFSLVLVVVAAGVMAVPAVAAATHPGVAPHPHTTTVHDRTPQAHVRNVTEHHGR